MPKENLLDRLAGAMKTLNKRQAKNLTPRQRVAAAQRWNSLADIGIREFESIPGRPYHRRLDLERRGIIEPISQYDYVRAANPFRFDWMGEPYQYEARLKNYKPLTDAQYERMLELEEEARQRDLDAIHQEWYDAFIEPWRY